MTQSHWRNYLIQDILPKGTMNLFAGPSGAGKTRLWFQMMRDWKNTSKVFGKTCLPAKFAYLCYDRSLSSVMETIESVGALGVADWIESRVAERNPTFPPHLSDAMPDCENAVLILDGLVGFVGGKIVDFGVVSNVLQRATEWAEASGITIIGILNSTKTREGESITNPRQMVIGSTAWAAYAETVMILQPLAPLAVDDTRRAMYFLPRNKPEFQMELAIENGLFIPYDDPSNKKRLTQFLNAIPSNQDIDTASLLDIGAKLNLPRRTIERYIKALVEQDKLKQKTKGVYRRCNVVPITNNWTTPTT